MSAHPGTTMGFASSWVLPHRLVFFGVDARWLEADPLRRRGVDARDAVAMSCARKIDQFMLDRMRLLLIIGFRATFGRDRQRR